MVLNESCELVAKLAQIPASAILIASFFGFVFYWLLGDRPYPGIPLIKLRDGPNATWYTPLKYQWIFQASDLLAIGKKTGKAFQVRAAAAYKIILPNHFAEEIRNHANLAFEETQHIEFPTTLPGWQGMYEGLRRDGLFSDIVRIKLTQSLGLVTDDIVEEADDAMGRWLSDDREQWKSYQIHPLSLDVVARISSRVFAGTELSRNDHYIRIAKENTVFAFTAGFRLNKYPRFLWPVLNWIFPECRTVRRQFKEATALLKPSIEATVREYKEDKSKQGAKTGNAIGWMIEVAKGRPARLENFVGAQLSLSMASMHNTSALLALCLVACVKNPEVVTPLRQEIITTLKENGWSKSSLQKMKLLDSFLKEVQRVNSLQIAVMSRYVKKTTILSDGTVLPAGSMTMVIDSGTQDPKIYPSPEKFIANRYLLMRDKPGCENRHQMVATSPDNLAFGHGNHACPGRFFAANEIKILMVFFLLRYDWRLEPGYVAPEMNAFEHHRMFPVEVMLQAKRRTEEINLLAKVTV